jgi:protein phosphatase
MRDPNETLNFLLDDDDDDAQPIHEENSVDKTQEIGWQLDVGQARTNNEDSLYAAKVSQASEGDSKSIGVYAVADGMGGHEAGEVASKLAVRTAVRNFMDHLTGAATEDLDPDMPDNYRHWLESAATIANQMVRNKSAEDETNMGTTLVMAVVVGTQVHIVNVGDSRAYLVSKDGMQQITKDHSYVQRLVDVGAISPEEAEHHPRRNMLTKAIGAEDDLTVDLYTEHLNDDQYLLLCSDGLTKELSDAEIHRTVMEAESPRHACQQLVARTNEAGGNDNIAVVIVRVKPRES